MTQGEVVVQLARDWLGTPYRHQASLKGVGADCIGLVRGVWRELYNSRDPQAIPPYAPSWYEVNDRDELLRVGLAHFERVPEPQAGDVLAFRMAPHASVKHCGIFTGEGTFIHAKSKLRVCEITLSPWWEDKIVQALRFP